MYINAVIILPTYNERKNIAQLLHALLIQQEFLQNSILSILVVDDSSPDGTAEVVKEFQKKAANVFLLKGKKAGLGKAYVRGMQYAMRKLSADIVFEMDADFSHNPNDIPRFISEIEKGATFVIGSRYVSYGSIPQNWSYLRKQNSKWGNIFARYIAGIRQVKDCTGGFRAIDATLLKKIALRNLNVTGYAFQISLLTEAIKKGATVTEIPIHFTDRQEGSSKLQRKDIIEFMVRCVELRFPRLRTYGYFMKYFLYGLILGFVGLTAFPVTDMHLSTLLLTLFAIFSLVMTMQGIFSLVSMVYAWDNPELIEQNRSPKVFGPPHFSFSALIPARHEERVIADTIKAIAKIAYPERLKEALIIIREDDTKTLEKAKMAIQKIGKRNIKIVTFTDTPINKSHSLNVGFKKAKNDVIVVFDAEDEPHKSIYNIVNTTMLTRNSDVVQSGIQLMNVRSRWFSALNVLEYYFWFKSSLQFFARNGLIPLGGNTVFFKKKWIKKVGGWDESCLTEDADIGIRLSSRGAKIDILYDERHTTREETPSTVGNFLRQRTRWNQGFMQVFGKGDWATLSKKSQKALALYILLWPIVQTVLLIYIPFAMYMLLTVKLPLFIAMLSTLPMYLLALQYITYNIGLYEFTRDYKVTYSLKLPLLLALTYYPFQILLGISAIRAVTRLIVGNTAWEKTLHLNAHRKPDPILDPAYA